jgi:flagellar FliL protein
MSKKLLIIIVAAVVVLVGGGAASYLLFLRPTPAQAAEEPAEETVGPAGLVTMETFLVNINDPGGERYAKVQIQLSVVPQSVAGALAGDELLKAKMRDRVLTLLAAKSFQELGSPIGKEGFRREVKARLDPLIEDGEIQEVLFQEFLVQ